jgi:hypothetical protein
VDVMKVLGDVAILPVPVKRIVLDILVEKRIVGICCQRLQAGAVR